MNWWSPVASANRLICFCSTLCAEPGPSTLPTCLWKRSSAISALLGIRVPLSCGCARYTRPASSRDARRQRRDLQRAERRLGRAARGLGVGGVPLRGGLLAQAALASRQGRPLGGAARLARRAREIGTRGRTAAAAPPHAARGPGRDRPAGGGLRRRRALPP